MKPIFIAALTIMLSIYSDCTTRKFTYYEGYIYTQENQPIANLRLYSRRIDPIYITDEKKTEDPIGITDTNGYFKFEMPKDRNRIRIPLDLLIEFEEKLIDSIEVWRYTPYPHRRVFYRFVEGHKDTLFIDLNGEKRSFERTCKRKW